VKKKERNWKTCKEGSKIKHANSPANKRKEGKKKKREESKKKEERKARTVSLSPPHLEIHCKRRKKSA